MGFLAFLVENHGRRRKRDIFSKSIGCFTKDVSDVIYAPIRAIVVEMYSKL